MDTEKETEMAIEKEEENQIKETPLDEPTATMETEKEPEMKPRGEKRGENDLAIHLGDILRILSPTNLKYHDKTFLVDYCGKEMLRIIDVESGFAYDLKLIGKNHSEFEEKEGIFSIELLSREKFPGYAQQNGLNPGVWVDVEFGGDLPFLVSGLITNLEEDQIEITLWPNQEVFYLDFRYEGIYRIEPKIEKIQIRDAPSLEAEEAMEKLRFSASKREDELDERVDGEQEEIDDLSPSLEMEEAETNRLESLRGEYVQGKAFAKSIIPEIEYEEVLGNYNQRVEQRKEDVRYSLSAQVEDFLNELLSTIPNFMRTPKVMEEIEHTLSRFRELHEMYARTNSSGMVIGFRSNRYRGKPLVSSILSSSEGGEGRGKWMRNMGWILPVVYLRKKGWHDVISEEGDDNFNKENNDKDGYFNQKEVMDLYDDGSSSNEWIENPACVWLKGIQQAIDKWIEKSGTQTGGNGGYRRLLQDLDEAMKPVRAFTKEQILSQLTLSGSRNNEEDESLSQKIIGPYESAVPLETIIDNTPFRVEGTFGNIETDGFYSTVVKGWPGDKKMGDDVAQVRRRFVIQKHVDAVSLLSLRYTNSGKKILERDTAVENEKMSLKSVMFLPEAWMAFSRIGLPSTDILTRVRLGSWFPQLSRILNKLTPVENVVIDDLTKDYSYKSVGDARCGSVHGKVKGKVRGKRGGDGFNSNEEYYGHSSSVPVPCSEHCDPDNGCTPTLGSGVGGDGAPEEEMAMGEFLSSVREYVLATENIKSAGSISQPLETLLNTVIPNNLYLIDFMCPYLKGSQYSLKHYAQIMEPFGIYLWNMRYAESYVMQKKLRDKITEYRLHTENERKEYGEMTQYFKKNTWGMNYRVAERFFHWFRSRGDDFIQTFLGWYHLNVGAITTSEILTRVYNLDEGRLMNVITTYFHYALVSLNRFTKDMKGGGAVGNGDWNWQEGERGGVALNGGRRKLAKRYNSLSELHDDDHRTDIDWDQSLDITPYYLEKRYGDETGGFADGNNEEGGAIGIALKINDIKQTLGEEKNDSIAVGGGEGEESGEEGVKQTMKQKLSASDYLEYLAMILKNRHFCPAEQAIELASILIRGKRPVKEGEYASVHMGGGDIGYYKRRHHIWERDNTLDFSKEGVDEKMVFSNLEKLGGGLGVRYTGGGTGGGKDALLDEREIATLSGDDVEVKQIIKWENKKRQRNSGGVSGEDENAKKQKELEKEMFQQKIQQSLKELEEMFEKSMKTQMDKTVRIYSLKQTEMKRANSFAYYLGKYKKETEMIASPHAALLELILEEPDFDLKQKYIVRFYHAFCREPILNGGVGAIGVEEKKYWKYCSETNVPLLPTSYYELALEYTRGGDYGALLDILCSQIGENSSDGHAIIDKYTGRILKEKNLDVEEGFDEMGFQRKTREILGGEDAMSGGAMNELGESSAAEGSRIQEEERRRPEKDAEEEEEEGEYLDKINQTLTSGSGAVATTKNQPAIKTAQDYGNGENELIARVALCMLQEMGLIGSEELVEDVIGFVIQMVADLLTNKEFIETEKRFEQKRKLALEKGKSFPFTSYEIYKNQKLLYATLGSILIAIQTITVEYKTTRNYSSCIRSLRGYPTGLGGSSKEDKSALRYIACLLLQQQSDESPWNARNTGRKEETHMTIISDYVDKYLSGVRAVEDRIGAKKSYELEYGIGAEETVPVGLRLDRQINLLPPMLRGLHVEDRQTMPVAQEFLEEWKSEIRRALKSSGEKGGFSDGVVIGRLMSLGSALFEQVNREIAGKVRELLMQSALGEPYLENACCQSQGAEEGPYPLGYFARKNPLIGKILKTSRVLERALERAEKGKKSVMLYHAESTRIGNGEFWDRGNGSSYFKLNIYAALIYYFNYDRPLLPVPEYLRGTVYEEPPKNYPVNASLKEKIEFLERAGRHYDVEKLQHCLMLVGQQNILSGGAIDNIGSSGVGIDAAEEEKGTNTKIGEALGDFLTSSIFELSPGSSFPGDYGVLLQKLTDVFREWKRGTMQNNSSPKIRALNNFLAKSNATMFERISKEWRATSEKERQLLSFLERVQVWNLAGDIDRESLNRANSDSLQQIVRFIRDMCNMFSFVYSHRIGVMEEFAQKKEKALPKHWGFAQDHYKLLSEYIQKTFGSLLRTQSANDNVLFEFFERLSVSEDVIFRQIRQLLAFFPVFTPLSLLVGENGEKEVFYALFPKETCYGVHVFCLYLILTRIMEVSQSYEMMNLDVQSRKKERLWQQSQRVETDNERDIFVSMENALEKEGWSSEGAIEDYSIAVQESVEERQIMEGKRSVLKEKIRQFVYDCLEIEQDNKQVVDVSYDELRKKQDETEKREKKRITDRLKKMEIYERRVDNQMKDLKLGNWNVGQQKGLFKYDKDTFKREMMEQQYGLVPGDMMEESAEVGGGVLYDTEGMDLGEDYLNGEEADRIRDMELNGEILGRGEDWDDGGEYY